MQFASLGSGSRGNATLVRAGSTLVMIDCGFSLRETARRLGRLGVAPEDLDAILVTHEHSDHASGVAALSRRYRLPIYSTHGTRSSGRLEGGHDYRSFNCGERFRLGELDFEAIAVPHDAAEPCQFRAGWRGRELGVLTDLGCVTPHVVESFRACHALLLEFNHDIDMLRMGRYPETLKRRVGGDRGHLSNHQAAELLRSVGHGGLVHVVVAHVSEKNNRRDLAEAALLTALDSLDGVVFADQQGGFDWLSLD